MVNSLDEFVKAITEGGWLGIAMPEAYGGAGLGITETTIMAHTIARSGAGMSGASAVHLNLFWPKSSCCLWYRRAKVSHVASAHSGLDRACFGVTGA